MIVRTPGSWMELQEHLFQYEIDPDSSRLRSPYAYRGLSDAGICQKIMIPRELKWGIRDHLDQANVHERLLFPGLDGLCSWLKRHYSEKK